MNAPLILIAEDTPDVLMVLIELLEMEGYRVHSASDGQAAWDYLMACNQLPDLIITDNMMPRLNGLDLCARIRAHKKTEKIPCMIYSASALQKKAAIKLACGFIAKPFDMDLLLETVKQAMNPKGDNLCDETLNLPTK